MKSADWLILKKLDDLEKLVVATQVQTNAKLDELLENKQLFVTPELERAIKNVSVLAASIDRKVPDKG
jgi:hypothetical protein